MFESVCMEVTVGLMILVEAKSFSNWSPSPFLSSYSFDHIAQTFPHFFCSSLFLTQYCANLVTHPLYLSCSIILHIFLFPWFYKHQKTDQSFCLQTDILCQVCVCVLWAMADIRKGKTPSSSPDPSLSLGLAQGFFRPSKTGPGPPFCHICVCLCMFANLSTMRSSHNC